MTGEKQTCCTTRECRVYLLFCVFYASVKVSTLDRKRCASSSVVQSNAERPLPHSGYWGALWALSHKVQHFTLFGGCGGLHNLLELCPTIKIASTMWDVAIDGAMHPKLLLWPPVPWGTCISDRDYHYLMKAPSSIPWQETPPI